MAKSTKLGTSTGGDTVQPTCPVPHVTPSTSVRPAGGKKK